MLAPVMKSDAAVARKNAEPTRSSGMPHRFIGVVATTRSACPGISFRACRDNGVSIQPGNITLTLMPCSAQAQARDFVSCTTPPLLAEYGAVTSFETRERIEPTFTIFPPRF